METRRERWGGGHAAQGEGSREETGANSSSKTGRGITRLMPNPPTAEGDTGTQCTCQTIVAKILLSDTLENPVYARGWTK